MKLYSLTILLALFAICSQAQTKAIAFDVDGLKVILRPTQKETFSLSMYYRGGVMNYSPAQSGIEHLALSAATTCGTKNYSVEDYKELADEYGIDLGGSSTTDYGAISMNCIAQYFDQGWKLFSDAVLNPSFDKTEFRSVKDKAIADVYQRFSDPETRIDQMSMESMFIGTPYATDPKGTEKSVSGFTADSVANYYHQVLLNKNRMFLVVAGKITKEDLEKRLRDAFKTLPAKPYTPPVYTQTLLKGEHLRTEQRDIATNYMNCVMNAPVMSSPDYAPFVLVVNALSGNLHYEIRTKQGLSYAPGATVNMQQLPYMSMYVSTTQPKKSFQAMVGVFTNIKAGRISENFLEGVKKDHKLRYYRHQESSSSIVRDLGEAEVLGSYKLEEDKVDNINKVTLDAMNKAFNNYAKGAIWLFLGDEQLGKAAFQ
ncbi:MAG: pitrilysin family protein [Bacteroidota bacterium]